MPWTKVRYAAVLLLGLAGCSTLLAVRGQERQAARFSIVSGTVDVEDGARGPLIVLLVTNDAEPMLVDHFVTEKPGSWFFAVEPGSYAIAAFEDTDRDGRYDDEPATPADSAVLAALTAGEQRAGIDVVIPRRGRFARGSFDLAELETRGFEEQNQLSLMAMSSVGVVTSLEDERFERRVANEGMWKFFDFLLNTRPGIFFLQPYDDNRVPVLFVHGMAGTPRDFSELIDALDRERFQPWVAYYPSGSRLDGISAWLAQIFARLRLAYGFDRAAVVAHSMGGLVSRAFLLEDWDRNRSHSVQTFVTISSPLGGMVSAGKGVERSPVVIRSWYGLAPGSGFLEGLFWRDPEHHEERRRLPEHISYHLLFGYRSGLGSGSSDGTVPLQSQLRPEAQQEASSLRGFDETHTSILRSDAVAAWLNEILDDFD